MQHVHRGAHRGARTSWRGVRGRPAGLGGGRTSPTPRRALTLDSGRARAGAGQPILIGETGRTRVAGSGRAAGVATPRGRAQAGTGGPGPVGSCHAPPN